MTDKHLAKQAMVEQASEIIANAAGALDEGFSSTPLDYVPHAEALADAGLLRTSGPTPYSLISDQCRDLGRVLRAVRGDASVEAVARRAGVTPATITEIERGNMDPTLVRVCDALGLRLWPMGGGGA